MVGEKEIYGGEYICEKMKSSCRSGRRMVTRVPQVSKSPSLVTGVCVILQSMTILSLKMTILFSSSKKTGKTAVPRGLPHFPPLRHCILKNFIGKLFETVEVHSGCTFAKV